jgi:hypothetical protein
MMIVKQRTASPEATSWFVYHTSLGATKYLQLNSTNASDTSSSVWSDTEPTSTVFTVANGFGLNYSGSTYVGYMFSEVAGYSKAFSYTGNGSTDSPFIYLGFKPKFILFKKSSASQNWLVFDSARSTYNQRGDILYPNLSSAEYVDSNKIDFLSNGVKIRSSQDDLNGSGGTYIGFAFAEVPSKFSLGV